MPRRAQAALLALVLAGCASAPPQPAATPPPAAPAGQPAVPPPAEPPRRNARQSYAACSQLSEDEVAVVDAARRRLHQFVCGTVLWVDGWFGGRGSADWARRTDGEAELSVARSEYEGWQDPRLRLRANVQIPALEDRLSAFVGRGDDESFVQGRQQDERRAQFQALRRRDDWFAGLRYALPEDWTVSTDLRVGARSLTRPIAFVQAVMSVIPYEDDNDLWRVRLIPFWNTRDHLGVTLRLDEDHLLGEQFLLRWTNSATEAQGIPGLDWREALILFHDLREERLLAWELFARGTTGLPEPLTEYGGRATYRQPLLPGRLVGEFGLGYSWPREDPEAPREGSFGISFGLTLPFGSEA